MQVIVLVGALVPVLHPVRRIVPITVAVGAKQPVRAHAPSHAEMIALAGVKIHVQLHAEAIVQEHAQTPVPKTAVVRATELVLLVVVADVLEHAKGHAKMGVQVHV